MTARDGGYTIFEALVAFAILASIITPLYAVIDTSLRLVAKGTRMDEAALLAQSKLDEIAAIRDPLPPSGAGTFPGSDVQWRIETSYLPATRPGIDSLRLQSVRLTLSWPEGNFAVQTRHLGAVRP